MRGKVVHHHYLARLQCRAEDLFEVGQEDIPIGGRLDRHHRLPSFDADGTQHRDRPPASIRCPFVDPLAPACSSVKFRHVRGDATFIKKHEPLGIDPGGFPSPLFPLPRSFHAILLTGVQTFFWRVDPFRKSPPIAVAG